METCDLFEKDASISDILIGIIICQLGLLRLYYSLKYPFDSASKLIRKTLSKIGLVPPLNESEARGKSVESFWMAFGVIISVRLYFFTIAFYFRWDRLLSKILIFGGHKFLQTMESWVICFGEMPHVSEDILELLKYVGVILAEAGVLLFFWVHYELREFWTPVIHVKKEHKLITGGPYRFVRHPMYSSFLIFGIGCGLACWNWIVLVITLISFLFSSRRVPVEEQVLEKEFGTQFANFKQQTKHRLIPFIY
jgi:protein-S-isoprenylcysteine O-methyltransferase Ste14